MNATKFLYVSWSKTLYKLMLHQPFWLICHFPNLNLDFSQIWPLSLASFFFLLFLYTVLSLQVCSHTWSVTRVRLENVGRKSSAPDLRLQLYDSYTWMICWDYLIIIKFTCIKEPWRPRRLRKDSSQGLTILKRK